MNKGLKIIFLAFVGISLIAIVFLWYFYFHHKDSSIIEDATTNIPNQIPENTAKEKETINNSFENSTSDTSFPEKNISSKPLESDADRSLDSEDNDSSINKNSKKFYSNSDDEEETDDGVTIEVESDDE